MLIYPNHQNNHSHKNNKKLPFLVHFPDCPQLTESYSIRYNMDPETINHFLNIPLLHNCAKMYQVHLKYKQPSFCICQYTALMYVNYCHSSEFLSLIILNTKNQMNQDTHYMILST